jgi:GMP synthase (glutamine-hydrolysing)
VFQWHGDMFHAPEEGKLLASGSDCPNQAFRFGNAFGLQFHVEITRDMLKEWFSDSPQLSEILARYDEISGELNRHAETIYQNFFDIITS